MEKDEIRKRIKAILVDDLFVADSVDDIGDDAKIGSDLGMDSVGFVELGTIVGEVFNFQVDDTDVGERNFDSVTSLTDFVHKRLQERAEPLGVEA
jgi:acyl carrier protein